MGASKKEFQAMQESRANDPELDQYIKMKMSMDDFWQLDEEIRDNCEFTVETRHDFSNYPEWVSQNKVCNKDYRKLREIEHDIAVNKKYSK